MKKVLLCVVVALSFAFEAFAASQFPITGSVSSEEGSAVAYATVVALQGGEQVAGTTTNDKGHANVPVKPIIIKSIKIKK